MKVEFGEGEGKVPLDAIAERAKKVIAGAIELMMAIEHVIEQKLCFETEVIVDSISIKNCKY